MSFTITDIRHIADLYLTEAEKNRRDAVATTFGDEQDRLWRANGIALRRAEELNRAATILEDHTT